MSEEVTKDAVEVPEAWTPHLEWMDSLTLMDASKLVSHLEEKWGVSAAAPAMAMVAPAAGDGDAAEVEKTAFDVILKSFGGQKIPVIKAIKEITGLGLKESKAIVDGIPKAVKTGVTKDEAESVKEKLEAAGAEVELK